MNERERMMVWALAKIDDPTSLISERDRPYLTDWITNAPEFEVAEWARKNPVSASCDGHGRSCTVYQHPGHPCCALLAPLPAAPEEKP